MSNLLKSAALTFLASAVLAVGGCSGSSGSSARDGGGGTGISAGNAGDSSCPLPGDEAVALITQARPDVVQSLGPISVSSDDYACGDQWALATFSTADGDDPAHWVAFHYVGGWRYAGGYPDTQLPADQCKIFPSTEGFDSWHLCDGRRGPDGYILD